MNEIISRLDASILLGVSIKTIYMMEKNGRIPTPSFSFLNPKTNRIIKGYDLIEFKSWVETNPILHCGYQDIGQRHSKGKRSAPKESDIYNIQRGGDPFVYSGYQKWWILNFQPALLNRGFIYD
jgi:hypothetical protein